MIRARIHIKVRSRIRIRIQGNIWIRIRLKMVQIRNPGYMRADSEATKAANLLNLPGG